MSPKTFALFPFQEKGIRTIEHFKGRVLLADEMGLGKTIQVLWYLKNHPEIRPAIIVVPAHMKWKWEEEAKSKCGLRAIVVSGRKPKRLNFVKSPLIIINYDILPSWLKTLRSMKPLFLAGDEIHFIKSRQAKRSKAFRDLSKRVPHCIGISGTPLLNRPSELFPILNVLWKKEFPSFFSYAQRYCKPVRKPWGWEYKGASHLVELHRRMLRNGLIRRMKSQVLTDLPPKRRTVIPLTIPMKNYKEARDNFLEWLHKQDAERARQAQKAVEICKLGYLKRLAAEEKIPLIIEWINSFLEETEDKLAVYGIHKAVVRGLHQKFPSISVCLDGTSSKRQKRDAEKQFQNDRKTRLFFGNQEAAGTGIGLTAAKWLAFVELAWSPGVMNQVEDRIHRIGQTRETDIVYLVAKGTIEERLCKILQEKQETVVGTLDGKRKLSDLNVFDELTKALKKGEVL